MHLMNTRSVKRYDTLVILLITVLLHDVFLIDEVQVKERIGHCHWWLAETRPQRIVDSEEESDNPPFLRLIG